MELEIGFPEKLRCLLQEKSRYKILFGGRGGSKSWGAARALLILGNQNKLRILCAREHQKSIKDSVLKLLADQIKELHLENFYEVQQTIIKGRNGTEFGFEGLRFNVNNIKSWEGADICWVEEAQTVSDSSWDILIPTIRKPESEIWMTLNPILEIDATYQRFIMDPPPNSILVKINWSDNKWFPEVLRQEMETLRRRDPIKARNIWDGECRASIDGAIYGEELEWLNKNNRITVVQHDPLLPVNTYWDLGYNDINAIWFGQHVGKEHRFIDYYENSGAALSHYVKVLKSKAEDLNYIYGDHYLPHDVEVTELSTGRSRAATLRSLGIGNLIVVKRIDDLLDGIEATRQMLRLCWFDKKRCADGVKALANYQREFDEKTQTFKQKPLHNWASNSADALRQFGQGYYEKFYINEKDLYPEECFLNS